MSVTNAVLDEYASQIDKGIELTYEEFERQYRDEWMQGLNLAYRYYIFHNNLDVPIDYSIDGYQLGHWIESQRKARKELTANQFELLDDLDMKWSVKWDYHRDRAKREIKYGDEHYAKWIEHLLQAKAFYEEHGHLDVPAGYKVITEEGKTFNLYSWILNQRHNYKINRIPSDRMSKLDNYFMIYDFTHKDEINRILEVKDHFFLPEKYRGIDPFVEEELPEIFGEESSVQVTKETFNFEAMVEELEDEINTYYGPKAINETKKQNTQKERLPHKSRWASKYEYARAYYEKHGHLLIPRSEVIVLEDGTEVKIGHWISNQRTKYKNGGLPKGQIADLEAIGMVWEPRIKAREIKEKEQELSELFGQKVISQEERWASKYEYAKAYYEKHGHLLIPTKEVIVLEDGTEVKIGQWLHSQRAIYKTSKMPVERQDALEAIGMVWSPRLEGKAITNIETKISEASTIEETISEAPIYEEPTLEDRIDSLSVESLKELEDSIVEFYSQLASMDDSQKLDFELSVDKDFPAPIENMQGKQMVYRQNKN